MNAPVLVGDIGGTKCLLALATLVDSGIRILHRAGFASHDFDSLGTVVTQFLADADAGAPTPTHACFAVAGPVRHDGDAQTAQLTNLPWRLHSTDLSARLNIASVRLINDLEAVGYGLDTLAPEALSSLQPGHATPHAPRAILGVGTGLGQAVQFWDGRRYVTVATEGGHVDFAPQDELQMDLLRELQAEYGHASVERVVSGPGLACIYAFLEARAQHQAPPQLRAARERGETAAAISLLALHDRDAVAVAALDLFVRVMGAQAGNLALSVNAAGGVFLVGGIPAKILTKLSDGAFVDAFNAKGRMAVLTRTFPVQVVNNPDIGLYGAVLAARAPNH